VGDRYEAFVMPNSFHRDAMEATVRRNLNIVTLYGSTIGELKFYGQGAGKFPTANAVIQDILDIYSHKTEYTIDAGKKIGYDDALRKNRYAIRTKQRFDDPSFHTIDKFQDCYYHKTGEITIRQMMELVARAKALDDRCFIIKEANFQGEKC